MRINVFSTFFTAWGYEVSYLEFVASVASFIGVALGITAKRITWPWWAISSLLYGIFFLQYKLYASAALQLVFIAAAIAGWYGWEPTGAKPGPFKNKYRLYTIAAILLATLALGPVLKWAGAASTYVDAILFFGSLAAQILMVYVASRRCRVHSSLCIAGATLYNAALCSIYRYGSTGMEYLVWNSSPRS
jgi:nicotinamide mononucleotide transporter